MVFLVLFEHAVGYALFRCQDVEDIGSLLPEVQLAVTEFSRFKEIVSLESFHPFINGTNALDNINSISEGVIHDDLQAFLSTNLPSGKKRFKVILGVADSKLGGVIQDSLEVNCQSGGVVNEVLRGVRLYFHRMIKGLSALSSSKAQLGLGHSYSRARVKFNVNRVDNMIIQSISLLDQLDKNINTFSMRIKEWYSYHFPELVKIVPDNTLYARVANCVGDRKQFTDDKIETIEEILMDSVKTQSVVEAARVSMGMDISPIDLINIQRFASRVIGLVKYRAELNEYLSQRMNNVAPNLTTLIGEQVGARLISHAGSLTNLAKYPASTVQILGAEKALFRALKTRGNTPKYGLIFHSTYIGRAGTKNKGRISRYLANKCSIASRIDCFTESPSVMFGSKLKGQVEERLTFYETGAIPRKNLAVMKEAIEENEKMRQLALSSEKKKKKKRKREAIEEPPVDDSMMDLEVDKDAEEKPKKKKKKSKKSLD